MGCLHILICSRTSRPSGTQNKMIMLSVRVIMFTKYLPPRNDDELCCSVICVIKRLAMTNWTVSECNSVYSIFFGKKVPSSIFLHVSNRPWKVNKGTIFIVLNLPAVIAISCSIKCALSASAIHKKMCSSPEWYCPKNLVSYFCASFSKLGAALKRDLLFCSLYSGHASWVCPP